MLCNDLIYYFAHLTPVCACIGTNYSKRGDVKMCRGVRSFYQRFRVRLRRVRVTVLLDVRLCCCPYTVWDSPMIETRNGAD